MRTIAAATLALLAAACSDKAADPKPDAPPAPPAPPASPAPPAAAENPMHTNGLSEAEFKALHTLTGEAAPAPKGEMVTIGDGQHYLSLPAGVSAPMPAVLVIHEWWGLNEHIKHYADRLAAEGYAALAVDLYGGQTAKTPDEAMKLMQQVDAAKAGATLSAAAAWLADDGRVRATKRGTIGWCFGGAWSLQSGLMIEGLDAVVMYYGRVETDPAALAGLDAPLLGIFATNDSHIPAGQVDAFEEALKAAGKTATIARYDAQHAFANPSSGAYDAEDAADAWQKARAFLAAHLQTAK
ncbi:MAG: dienelactone hydrolase family protein [Myxococcales bacterium]|nr:dienelactone hydrolase family protein [Myxococcales bacterium]